MDILNFKRVKLFHLLAGGWNNLKQFEINLFMPEKKGSRIRVRLKSYDSRVIDQSTEKIVDTAIRTGAQVTGPIPLPTKKQHFDVIRGPHIDKRSGEKFQLFTHKRLIDIIKPTAKTIESLSNLDLPAGVGVEIKM